MTTHESGRSGSGRSGSGRSGASRSGASRSGASRSGASRSGAGLSGAGGRSRDEQGESASGPLDADAPSRAQRGVNPLRSLEDDEHNPPVLRHLDGVHRTAFLRALAQLLMDVETRENRMRAMRQLDRDSP